MADVWESSFRACSLSSDRERIILAAEARKGIVGGLVELQRRREQEGVGQHFPCRCSWAVPQLLLSSRWILATLVGVLQCRLKGG